MVVKHNLSTSINNKIKTLDYILYSVKIISRINYLIYKKNNFKFINLNL